MSRVLPELHHSFLRTGQMLVGSPHLSTLKQCLLKTSFMIPSLIRTWEASKQETPPHRSCIRSHRIAWRKILDMNWVLQWIKITWIPLSNQVNLLSPYFSKKNKLLLSCIKLMFQNHLLKRTAIDISVIRKSTTWGNGSHCLYKNCGNNNEQRTSLAGKWD